MPAGVAWRVKIGEVVGAPQIDAGQVFIGRKNTDEVFTRDPEELGQARPHADKHGLVALIKQALDRNGAPADPVGAKFHTISPQTFQLRGHNILGQTEGGDAVDEHAARFVQGFKNGDLDAFGREIAGYSDGGWSGTDAGNLQVFVRRHRSFFFNGKTFTHGGVGNVAFQAANGHRLPFAAENAFALALVFLWADPSANRRQAVGAFENAVGFGYIALGKPADKLRDAHFHGAALPTVRFFALKTARGFKHRLFARVAESHFTEVARALRRRLAGHVHARGLDAFAGGRITCHGRSTCGVRENFFPEF